MTNEERALKVHRRQGPPGPWVHSRELKRFWVIARQAGVSTEGVHAIIAGHYPGKNRLHDLTRVEFIRLMDLLFHGPAKPSDIISDLDIRHGSCADSQWRKIRWLQRRLRWDDTHLVNYIMKECGIHHVRFLTTWGARAVITGLEKIYEK